MEILPFLGKSRSIPSDTRSLREGTHLWEHEDAVVAMIAVLQKPMIGQSQGSLVMEDFAKSTILTTLVDMSIGDWVDYLFVVIWITY
eukprot:5815611-Amphidinium_carterae.2